MTASGTSRRRARKPHPLTLLAVGLYDHPRWSQAGGRRIGEFFKRKTLPFNGYADQVAHLYAGMDLKKSYWRDGRR